MHHAARSFPTFLFFVLAVLVAPAPLPQLQAGVLAPFPSVAVDEESIRDDAGADAAAETRPMETEQGRAALAAASRAKKAAYALEGEAREQALLEAAAAYGAVADDEAGGALDRCEGAFRAGEILRARGLLDEAAERFSLAVTVGGPSEAPEVREFAGRALLEQAHRSRRDGALEDALSTYGAVRARFGDRSRPCAHAVTWSGKLLLAEGRVAEAREVLLDLEPFFPDRAQEAVRNVDRLVDGLLGAGEVDQAHEAVARLEARITAGSADDGETVTAGLEVALGALRDKLGRTGY